MQRCPSAKWCLSYFSSSGISHFTDEAIEVEENWHWGSCHLCKLELVFGGPKSPGLGALFIGHDIGIQVTLGKWLQAIPKGTSTHHRFLTLRNSYFSCLPVICSQVAGSLSSPQLDMWIPDVHSIASSCAFASCSGYHMSVATHSNIWRTQPTAEETPSTVLRPSGYLDDSYSALKIHKRN